MHNERCTSGSGGGLEKPTGRKPAGRSSPTLLAGWGLGHVLTLHNFGGLAPEAVERSMRLFAEEALPRALAAGPRLP